MGLSSVRCKLDARSYSCTTTVSLKTSYQQADSETTLRVVLGAGELREAQ